MFPIPVAALSQRTYVAKTMSNSILLPVGSGAPSPASAPPADASDASLPRRRIHALRQERQDAARLKAALIQHVGIPSVAQMALIDAIAELKVKIAVFDKRFIEEGGMSPHARREYLAFVNSFGRLLAQLGMHGPASKAATSNLSDFLAGVERRGRARKASSSGSHQSPPPTLQAATAAPEAGHEGV